MCHQTTLLGDRGRIEYLCPEEKSRLPMTVSSLEGHLPFLSYNSATENILVLLSLCMRTVPSLAHHAVDVEHGSMCTER